MKFIINEYGKMILTSVIGMLLLLFICNVELNGEKGIVNIIGSTLVAVKPKDEQVDVKFLEQGNQNIPQICKKTSEEKIYINAPISLDKLFVAYDQNNEKIEVQILNVMKNEESMYRVMDENGDYQYFQEIENFNFTEAGFYDIEVCAKDSLGIASTVWITIAVNDE